jgi:hypothetical protein
MQPRSAREYHLIHTGWCQVHFLLSRADKLFFHGVTPNVLGVNWPCSLDTHLLHHRLARATHDDYTGLNFCRTWLVHRLHGTNTRPRKQT